MVSKKLFTFAAISVILTATAVGDTLLLTQSPAGSQKVTQIDAGGVSVNSTAVTHKRTGNSYAVGKLAGATGFDIAAITTNTGGKGVINVNRYDATNAFSSTVSLGKSPVGFTRIVGLADFDADGRNEVVVLNPASGSRALFLIELQANGSLVTTTIALDPTVSFGSFEPGLGVADMDNDGDPDLPVQDPATHQVKFVRFAGTTPSATLATPTLDPATFGGTSALASDAIFDVNGNGIGDFLFRPNGASQGGKTLWFLNANLQKSGAAVKYLTGNSSLLAVGTGTVGVVSNTVDVSISMSAFSPKTLNVNKGTTVRWTNNDAINHTVTTDVSGSGPNSDATFPSGLTHSAQYSFTVPANAVSGTKFFYHCRFHGSAGNGTNFGIGMTGVIIVN